jgi:transcriptional regulator with XRE-family HTH domain
MNLIDIAHAFKVARLTSRRTQDEVAQAAGVGVITVSRFERGALSDIGAVKLLALLRQVGLELAPRRIAQQRTLNDIADELDAGTVPEPLTRNTKRVRHGATKP